MLLNRTTASMLHVKRKCFTAAGEFFLEKEKLCIVEVEITPHQDITEMLCNMCSGCQLQPSFYFNRPMLCFTILLLLLSASQSGKWKQIQRSEIFVTWRWSFCFLRLTNRLQLRTHLTSVHLSRAKLTLGNAVFKVY